MNAATIISADQRERLRQFLRDLWDYRELFWTFVERDIKVRYKQTALGVIWVILQPLLMSGAFALIFGKIARMPTDGLPILLFYLAATVPWNTFATTVSQSAMSMEANAGLITKIYFPRVVIPGAIVFGSLLDFTIGWALLNGLALWMGHWRWQMVALTPLLLLIQSCAALGVGLALGALNAQYRDVKHAVPFLMQVLMLATPVIYPASRLPEVVQRVLFLNPMAGVVTAYRSLLETGAMDTALVLNSLAIGILLLAAGLWFFRSREARMADIL
ncbi:MAG: ABC transporter permease [Verrucomicrobiae bacterium]|nr:ABC transporter permease [Verrucomicrobiae bacterium]